MNAYHPDMTAGYFEAGLLYYLGGDTDTAEARINQALADEYQPFNVKVGTKAALDAVIADCHHMLSLIDFDHHDYIAAGKEAERALRILNTRESYFIARAQAEVQLNMIKEAKKDIASALKLNPTYLPATRLDKLLKL
jgi:tetratricopeptide (TPR) repeat protein